MDSILASGVVAAIVAGAFAVLQMCLQRHWKQKDAGNNTNRAIVDALKLMMLDKVHYLGGKYIQAGEISLRDKDTLKEMHKAYKALGGNGHLDTVMAEVDKLPVSGDAA